MQVASILKSKGSQVETVDPETKVAEVVRRIAELGIGALVVSGDGEGVLGVISERDVVRGLERFGETVMAIRVKELMSRNVPLCKPEDNITRVMALMTGSRMRHLPVVESGKLCGVVSIGDIVKHRLDEIELENNVLRDFYVTRGGASRA